MVDVDSEDAVNADGSRPPMPLQLVEMLEADPCIRAQDYWIEHMVGTSLASEKTTV